MTQRQFTPPVLSRHFAQFAAALAVLCLLRTTVLRAQTTAAPPGAAGQLRLPHILSDHAVLQRDRPIHIWGWDAPGAAVTVDFRGQHASTHADELGAWSVYLDPEPAGGPYTLTVHGAGAGQSDDITLTDILVGDVWFASGQSNMEIPLNGFPGSAVIKDAAKEIASANDPAVCGQVRLLLVRKRSIDFPLNDQPSTWTECNSTTAANFSAVAFFFGREIHAREHIPIGLIDSTWGGTPIASWISLDALASDAGFMPVFAQRARFAALQPDLAVRIAYEHRAVAAAKAANQPVPQFMWHPNQVSWEPSFLFNGMIAPAVPYTIRGFLWYQGETDSNPSNQTPQLYNRLFPALIRDWRARWNEGDLPFLYVQISNFNSPREDWGVIRDAQRQTLAVTNTAMAVSLDVGTRDNVHPPDKQTVASRLALAARDLVYGEHVEDSGPLPISVTSTGEAPPAQGPAGSGKAPDGSGAAPDGSGAAPDGSGAAPDGSGAAPDGLRIWFAHAKGLHATGETLRGFEIAGPDNQFHPADATIDGTTVIVHSTAVPHPVRVRYAWSSFTDANLANAAGLPASTFILPEAETP